MMVAALFSRGVRALCLSGIALSMTAAVAQETIVTLQHVNGVNWPESVAACSDPETEVGNGTSPPRGIGTNAETEVDNDPEASMESYNFPEGEVGNGTEPPNINP